MLILPMTSGERSFYDSSVVLTSHISEQKYMYLQFKKIPVAHAKLGLSCF